MRSPRAVVFDLDGTLADTRLDIAAACNHVLVALGRAPRSVVEISGFVGDGSRVLLARALGSAAEDAVTHDAMRIFEEHYPLHAADHVTWMPGAREALDAALSIPLPLALATNKPRSATLPVLAALGIESCFRSVVAGGSGPLKPHPAAIHTAAAALGVSPRDAWVVGDGPQDVGAGRAAGAWTVAVLGGFASEARLREAGPDMLVGSMHEVAELLRRVRGFKEEPP